MSTQSPSDRPNLPHTKSVAVVLAAGSARRFGGGKQLSPVGGRPLIRWAVEAALASDADRVLVVLGHRKDEVAAVLPDHPRLTIIGNPHHEQGMGSSLALAAQWCIKADAQVMTVVLGDQPLVRSETISLVTRAALQSPSGAAAAEIKGRRGHPAAFASKHFTELAGLAGDEGGRVILDRLGDKVELVPAAIDSALDVDQPQDLERVQAVLNSMASEE